MHTQIKKFNAVFFSMLILLVCSCNQKASVHVTTVEGAARTKIYGTVYTTAASLTGAVSATEVPISGATVKIYKITTSSAAPTLITTTLTDGNGAYSERLEVSSKSIIMVVAHLNNANIGHALAVATQPTNLTQDKPQPLRADITILSTLTARLLIKKNVTLETIDSNRLSATIKIVSDQITANGSTDSDTLFTTLIESTSFASSLITAIGEMGAGTNRSQTAFEAITSVVLSSSSTTSGSTTTTTSSTTTSSSTQAPPPDPTGQGAIVDSSTQLTISWTSGGGSTASYKIAYQAGATAPANCATGTTTTSTITSVAVTGLLPGTQYSFRICALNSNSTADISTGTTTTATTSPFVISSWAKIDGNASTGINKNIVKAGTTPQLTSFNSKLYSIWSEVNGGGIYNIRVAVYNGNDTVPSWAFVDGNGANGINKISGNDSEYPHLIEFNSKLYATWGEPHQIRMAVYNGNDSAPSWDFVDGNGVTGINRDTSKVANTPTFAVFNSKLYATWGENNGVTTQIRTTVYNGNDSAPSWSFVDGNGANGLNKDPSQGAIEPQLVVSNSKLYITWTETNGFPQQVRVAVYNGNDGAPSWTFVDGNAVTGLNRNPAQGAYAPQITDFNSKLYITWFEHNGTAIQIRALVYNGNDGAPSWAYVDGNGANGLNKDPTQATSGPQLTVFSSTLYAVWSEGNATGQIRVAAYNGNDSSPAWTFADGNGATGINKDVTKSAEKPQLTVFNSKLYSAWQETDGVANQIRAAVAQ